MDFRFTDTPEEYSSFFFAENKITHPEYEYIIHLDEPRCFIKFKTDLAMFASYEEFYKGIAEVQWIDGVKPEPDEQKRILTKAWNYLAIEESILDDDLELNGGIEDE